MSLLALGVVGRGVVPPDEPVLTADDEGFLRGRAVFDTLRVYGGRPFRLDDHLERLARSAARVGVAPPDAAGFRALVPAVVEAGETADAVLRLLWTPGPEGAGAPGGLVLVSRLPAELEELRERGLGLAVVEWTPGALAGTKSTSYAAHIGARDGAIAQGRDDALLVAQGVVLEASLANVWWREGDRLLTPSTDLPILRGVTRGVLLELAPAAGYEIDEGSWPLDRLLSADEAFISSSVREVMPVFSVDGQAIGDGQPGPAAAALQRALRAAATGTS